MIKFINNANSSKVKVSNTVEELPTTGKEKDLAVVYREEIQPFQESTQTQVITFPDTVVLDEAFTGSVRGRLRSVDPSKMFDGNVMLDPNMFRFDGFGETEMIRVEYRSTDGITYTRERMEPDTTPIDLGTQIKWEPIEPFNPVVGKFMQVGGNTFEGLYEYKTNIEDKTKIRFPDFSKASFDVKDNSITNVSFDGTMLPTEYDVQSIRDTLVNNGYLVNGSCRLLLDTSGNIYAIAKENKNSLSGVQYLLFDTNKNIIGISTTNEETFLLLALDLKNKTVTSTRKQFEQAYNGDGFCRIDNLVSIIQFDVYVSERITTGQFHLSVLVNVSEAYPRILIKILNNSYIPFKTYNAYVYAPTQLTLQQPNQLLPGVIAYGKNGEITGDNTVYDAIGYDTFQEHYSGVDVRFLGTKYTFLDLDNSIFRDKIPMTITAGSKQALKYHQTFYNTKGTGIKAICNTHSIVQLNYDISNNWSLIYYDININQEKIVATGKVNQYNYDEALIQVSENLGYVVITDVTSSSIRLYELKDDAVNLVGTATLSFTNQSHRPKITYLNGKVYIGLSDGEGKLYVYAYANQKLTQLKEILVPNISFSQEYYMRSSGNYAYYINEQSYGTDEGAKHTIIAINSNDDSVTSYNITNDYMYDSYLRFAESNTDNIYVMSKLPSTTGYTLGKITPTGASKLDVYNNYFLIDGIYDEDTNTITCKNGLQKGCSMNISTGEQHFTKAANSDIKFNYGKITVQPNFGNAAVILGDTFVATNPIDNENGSTRYLAAIFSVVSDIDFKEDTKLQNPIFRVSDSVAIQYGIEGE